MTTESKIHSFKRSLTNLGVFIFSGLAAIGCSNGLNPSQLGALLAAASPTPSPSSSSLTLVISSVVIAGNTGTTTASSITTSASPTPSPSPSPSPIPTPGTPPPLMNVFFNTTKSTQSIATLCNLPTSANATNTQPCLCQFTWNEINPYSGSSVPVSRSVQTNVTALQPNVVSCSAPEVFYSDIPDGVQVSVTVVPGSTNPNLFIITPFPFIKNSTAVSGSFQDIQGNIFDNVLHYSCYNLFQRGLQVQSKGTQITPPGTITAAPLNAYMASQFCLAPLAGNTGSATECPSLSARSYSAQVYYYNLYIRTLDSGGIVPFNNSFVCPLVTEALGNNGTKGTQSQAWPLDSTYALSLAVTATFNVGVQANTALSGQNDPTNVSNTCFPGGSNTSSSSSTTSGSSTGSSNTLTSSCLGFAATPNKDGTCPSFTDSTGLTRPTYRLRRFVALYPRTFDTDGNVLKNTPQAIDTAYVLDRPVTSPANADPTKPYTMMGPKPCPFSFFDTAGVNSSATPPVSNYYGTSNPIWNNKNVDGIQFPNIDDNITNSCSAIFPVLTADKSKFFLQTLNKSRSEDPAFNSSIYIRPIQSFTPHYEEDVSFQACAPQASPMRDPPLHFSRDPVSKNVAWCAESYPSQNTSVALLDPGPAPTGPPTGLVYNFTSHLVNNTSSAACTFSALPSLPTGYPASGVGTGVAGHGGPTGWEQTNAYSIPSLPAIFRGITANTCDRTVSSSGLSWAQYPLLAPAIDIEQFIHTDRSYYCTVTYDNNGGKTNKATPSGGCCNSHVVQVTPSTANTAAHLEPDAACGSPQY